MWPGAERTIDSYIFTVVIPLSSRCNPPPLRLQVHRKRCQPVGAGVVVGVDAGPAGVGVLLGVGEQLWRIAEGLGDGVQHGGAG